jgi:Leucine-rich repeat (LRR) protein
LANVAKFPNLTILDASGTKITDAALKDVAHCPKLNCILLSHTSITDDGIQPLGALTNLTHLTIIETKVTERGIERLRQALPKLTIQTAATIQGPLGAAPQPIPPPSPKSE